MENNAAITLSQGSFKKGTGVFKIVIPGQFFVAQICTQTTDDIWRGTTTDP